MSLHVSGQPGPGRQAYQETDGSWTVEVNNAFLSVPNLEAAKRLFVEKYDRSRVQLSPGSLGVARMICRRIFLSLS
jgi:hypothetical protein